MASSVKYTADGYPFVSDDDDITAAQEYANSLRVPTTLPGFVHTPKPGWDAQLEEQQNPLVFAPAVREGISGAKRLLAGEVASPSEIGNRLTGIGGERFQTWPEKIVRSGFSLPHDVVTGEVPVMQGEHTSPELIERTQDLSGLMGGGSVAGIGAKPANSLGTFGGARAKTANLEKLAQAKKMEGDGYFSSDIWDKTGWFKGTDGQWRFEIPDNALAVQYGSNIHPEDLKGTGVEHNLNVVRHDKLFDAYPELLKSIVTIQQGKFGGQFGLLDGNPNIRITAKDLKDVRTIATHELQHAVQNIEGFSAGASMDVMRRVVNMAVPKKILDNLTAVQKDNLIYEMYKRNAGETEARNVQTRLDYTPNERSALPPNYTQDVATELQSVRNPHSVVANMEYRGEHGAPDAQSGSPLHDVTLNGTYPKDFYSHEGKRYYSPGHDDLLDASTYKKIVEAKNNPDKLVNIYRAIPWEGKKPGIVLHGKNERSKINPGDWVTLSKKYAEDHGESALNGKYAITMIKVPAKELFTAGDSFHEWGWSPQLLSDTSANAPLSALAKAPVFYSAVEHAVKNMERPLVENGKIVREPIKDKNGEITGYKVIKRKMSDNEKMSAEQWLGELRNQPGVKQEELDWVLHELPKGQITKTELERIVNEHKVELKEVNKGELTKEARKQELESIPFDQRSLRDVNELSDIADGSWQGPSTKAETSLTKYSQWQLPGGSNYREMLLTLPDAKAKWQQHEAALDKMYGKNKWSYDTISPEERARGDAIVNSHDYLSSHWPGIENPVAHIRMNDRDIPGVGKSLHIEEIQSDWHQAGRKQGYKGEANKLQPEFDKIEKKILDSNDESVMSNPELKDALAEAVKKKIISAAEAKVYERYSNIIAHGSTGGVPDAPLKTTWADLGLKRMIRQAAENGYDAISWTPGEAQAARYDLSKHVDQLSYDPAHNRLRGWKNGEVIIREEMPPSKLADTVGKDVAEKLLQQPLKENPAFKGALATPVHTLSGLELKVGGEGMKAFYDKMLVDKANAIAKKFGGKVEQKELAGDARKFYIEKVERINGGDYYEVRSTENDKRTYRYHGEPFTTEAEANAKMQQLQKGENVHVLRITPQLRDAAINKGFSLFADTGKVGAPLAALTKVEHNPFTATAFHGSPNPLKGERINPMSGIQIKAVDDKFEVRDLISNRTLKGDFATKDAAHDWIDKNALADFYSTPNPRLAGDYATHNPFGKGHNITPLRLDISNYHTIDAKGQPWDAINQFAINEANQLGKKGVIVKNVFDDADPYRGQRGPQTVYITLDPSTVRSRFAKFDPAKFGESGLLKAGGLPIYSDENGNQLLPTSKGLRRLSPVSHDPFKLTPIQGNPFK